MIRYALICEHEHEFEAWFSNSSDYDAQEKGGLLMCPHCGTAKVTKAIMAPNVSTARKKEETSKKQAQALAMMNKAADKIRQEIAQNCDYVGENFTEEARAIHYGEKPERGIYGQATPEQAKSLIDEGVGVAPLPDILSPKPKKDVN